MIQTLSDNLLMVLQAYEWSWKPFVSVLDYHTLDQSGYPYLTFEPNGFVAQIDDTCNNLRTYTFQVLVFQEVTETGGRKEAKEILSKAMTDVINILDENYTLDGAVTRLAPIGWTITPYVTSTWKCLVWEILVNIDVIEFIK